MKKRSITLCYRCRKDYEGAGFIIERDYSNSNQSQCDKCNRQGYDYWVSDQVVKSSEK